MPVPRVAIVGRPNVGKSSLLNMLASERVAIVDPTPGVTRDRVSTLVDLETADGTRVVELTDTGGFGVYTAEGARYDDVGADLASLTKDIESQIAEAISSADIILFALDTQAGLTPQDQHIAKLLREQRLGRRQRADELVPVHVVATKCDGPKWETHAYEFAALGLGEPLMCSAKNNYLRRAFTEALIALLPPEDDTSKRPRVDLMLAVIGKRNVGKSSLVNALAGEERVIVSEIAGTTRDAVDVLVEFEGKKVLLTDTAGLRRKRSFQGQLEWYAFDRAQRSIERADAVLLLVDASEKLSQVDEQLAMIVQKSFKPVVVVINKWDLVADRKNRRGNPMSASDYAEYVSKELKGLAFAPVSVISATDGTNLLETIEVAFDVFEQASTRVGTGEINRSIRKILDAHHPPAKGGKIAKLFYASQVTANPPTIVLIVNEPDLFTHSYRRYMMNRFREVLPYPEVPIKLVIRARKREDEPRLQLVEAQAEPERDAFDRALLAELPDDPDAYFFE